MVSLQTSQMSVDELVRVTGAVKLGIVSVAFVAVLFKHTVTVQPICAAWLVADLYAAVNDAVLTWLVAFVEMVGPSS
jgi:hypothetical protein